MRECVCAETPMVRFLVRFVVYNKLYTISSQQTEQKVKFEQY